jgi:hypothetical protein
LAGSPGSRRPFGTVLGGSHPRGDSPVGRGRAPRSGPYEPAARNHQLPPLTRQLAVPNGGPKFSKSRPRRVLRIKTGPLTTGKMSCTDRLHTSPIVKDPYSNCVLGTERLHGWHPPNDGRRVYERHTGPVGFWLGSAPPRRGPCGWAVGGGSDAQGMPVRVRPGARTRRDPRAIPGARCSPRAASARACGLLSWTLAPRRPAGPPRVGGLGWGPPVGGWEMGAAAGGGIAGRAPSGDAAGAWALTVGVGALNAAAPLADGVTGSKTHQLAG